MLKRIHQLRNIGRFQDCRAGGVEFGRLTIVYGRNTYGKSTVGDIFASISTGDTSLITGRATIPADGDRQRIRFSVQVPNTAGESDVRFEGDTWTQPLPPGLGVKTFDDGFLHNNLFAARAVTRSTKENFSAYILGEQGVQKAKVIAEKRKDRQQLTRDRNKLERDAFSRIDDIPTFVALAPNGTKEEAEERLQALRSEHTAVLKQRKDIDDIQARSEGTPLNWADDFSRFIGIVNPSVAETRPY
jgi:wobble nucleotide-excising tRNase